MAGNLDLNSERFDKHPDFMRALFAGLFRNPDLRQLVSEEDFVKAFDCYEDFIDFFLLNNITSVAMYLDGVNPESDQVFTEQSHVLLKLCAEYLSEDAPEAPCREYRTVMFDDLQLALAYGDMLGHMGGRHHDGFWKGLTPAYPYRFGVMLMRLATHLIAVTKNETVKQRSLVFYRSRYVYLAMLARASSGNAELITKHVHAIDDSVHSDFKPDGILKMSLMPAFSGFAAD